MVRRSEVARTAVGVTTRTTGQIVTCSRQRPLQYHSRYAAIFRAERGRPLGRAVDLEERVQGHVSDREDDPGVGDERRSRDRRLEVPVGLPARERMPRLRPGRTPEGEGHVGGHEGVLDEQRPAACRRRTRAATSAAQDRLARGGEHVYPPRRSAASLDHPVRGLDEPGADEAGEDPPSHPRPGRRQHRRVVEQEGLDLGGGEVVEACELEQRLELAARDLRHRATAP